MNGWRKSKQGIAVMSAGRVAGLLFGAIVLMVLYAVRVKDLGNIAGIPVPMVVITIATPVLLAGLVFWFARTRERHDWQGDDEE